MTYGRLLVGAWAGVSVPLERRHSRLLLDLLLASRVAAGGRSLVDARINMGVSM